MLAQQWTLLHSQSSKALAQTQSSTRDLLAQTQSSAGELMTSLTPAPSDLALPDAHKFYADTVGGYLEQVSCQVLAHELCQGQDDFVAAPVVVEESKEAEVVEDDNSSLVTTTVITLSKAAKVVPLEDFQFEPMPLLIQESLFDATDDDDAIVLDALASAPPQGMELVMTLPEI
jgi:hypothetical protein